MQITSVTFTVEQIAIIASIISALVAIYAAYVSRMALREQRKMNTPQINTIIKQGYAHVLLSGGFDDKFETIETTIINEGNKPITVEYQALELLDKWIVFPQAIELLPVRLEAESNYPFAYDAETVKNELLHYGYRDDVKVRAVFMDQAGRVYKSNYINFDLTRRLLGEGQATIHSRKDFVGGCGLLQDKGQTLTVKDSRVHR